MKRCLPTLDDRARRCRCALAGPATGDGGGANPGVDVLSGGVLSPNGKTRYVAIPDGARTVVAQILVRNGAVLRSLTLNGRYGVAYVTNDGTVGGLSFNGRVLVLSAYSGPTVQPPGEPLRRRRHQALAAGRDASAPRRPHVRRPLAQGPHALPDRAHVAAGLQPLPRPRLRPRLRANAAPDDRRPARAERRHGRQPDGPRDEPGRRLGVHALPAVERELVRPRARHAPRRGRVHRPAPEGDEELALRRVAPGEPRRHAAPDSHRSRSSGSPPSWTRGRSG